MPISAARLFMRRARALIDAYGAFYKRAFIFSMVCHFFSLFIVMVTSANDECARKTIEVESVMIYDADIAAVNHVVTRYTPSLLPRR